MSPEFSRHNKPNKPHRVVAVHYYRYPVADRYLPKLPDMRVGGTLYGEVLRFRRRESEIIDHFHCYYRDDCMMYSRTYTIDGRVGGIGTHYREEVRSSLCNAAVVMQRELRLESNTTWYSSAAAALFQPKTVRVSPPPCAVNTAHSPTDRRHLMFSFNQKLDGRARVSHI